MSTKFNEQSIFFDVDETLVMWENYGKSTNPDAQTFHLLGSDYKLVPHKKHIELLKQFKSEGFIIVVWSAAGAPWAREVVTKLELTKYVDHTLSKPEFYVDDKFPEQFLHRQNRIYYPQGELTDEEKESKSKKISSHKVNFKKR